VIAFNGSVRIVTVNYHARHRRTPGDMNGAFVLRDGLALRVTAIEAMYFRLAYSAEGILHRFELGGNAI
jgi:hypothetical protein